MARLKDSGGRDLCLAMTHEEAVTDLASAIVSSYRQLPVMVYQVQTKFRDEPRSRGGLIRVREFTMKDGYSFHADAADLDAYYPRVHQAYVELFRRCGLDVIDVESDSGMMGGSMAHEFMALTPVGEDTLILCEACGYAANRQVAAFRKEIPPAEAPLPLVELATPGTTTIAELSAFLDIPAARTAKAVFMSADVVSADGARERKLVFAVLRGDMELNETKLANAVGALELRPAQPEEIAACGAVAGYGSPVGIRRDGVVVVADDLLPHCPNLVAGANRPDTHLGGCNLGRDWSADLVADIAAAAEGRPCARCGEALIARRGVEVGNIFKLGTRYSAAMGASFQDADGRLQPMVMGCYGIGSGRLMACVVEAHHDDAGIVWPASVAPYQVHLVSLATEQSPELAAAADALYDRLRAAGLEVLYDDRAERPGVKFNDADLIGLPWRLTLGSRGLAAGRVELRVRSDGSQRELDLESCPADLQRLLDAELARLAGAPATPD
jgi:prolyl-tRNA synthetase